MQLRSAFRSLRLGRFGRRILTTTGAVTIVVVVLLSALFLRSIDRLSTMLDELRNQYVRTVADSSGSEIELSLTSGATDKLLEIVNRLKEKASVQAVFIFGAEKTLLMAMPDGATLPPGIVPSEIGADGRLMGANRYFARTLKSGDTDLGSLVVAAHNLTIVEEEKRKAMIVAFSAALGSLAIGIAIFWILLTRDIGKLRSAFQEVADVAVTLTASSSELQAAGQQMTMTGKAQADKIADATAAVAEMSTSIGEVTTTAQQARGKAEESQEAAVNGEELVRGSVKGMDHVQEIIHETGNRMSALGESGKKIGKIVDVVTTIAEQTSLLALNAAIEAARAGEHGRGFAVVADEVSKLADRVARSAKEIETLISEIQNGARQAVEITGQASQEVGDQVKAAHEASRALLAISESVTGITQMVASIAVAMDEQNRAAQEIHGATEIINQSSRETTAAINSFLAAGDDLQKQASVLNAAVARSAGLIGS